MSKGSGLVVEPSTEDGLGSVGEGEEVRAVSTDSILSPSTPDRFRASVDTPMHIPQGAYVCRMHSRIQRHRAAVTCVRWSPTNKFIASGCVDGLIRIYSTQGGGERVFMGHRGPVTALDFNPTGTRLVSVGTDRTVRQWRMRSGSQHRAKTTPVATALSVAHNAEGSLLAVTGVDPRIFIYDAVGLTLLRRLHGGDSTVLSLSWSTDSAHIASVSEDGMIRVWDVLGSRAQETKVEEVLPISVSWAPLGAPRLAVTLVNGDIKLLVPGEGLTEEMEIEGHSDMARAARWLADGSAIATTSMDGTCRVWDADTGECACVLIGHRDWVSDCDWSPANNHIVTCGHDGMVRLWDLSNASAPDPHSTIDTLHETSMEDEGEDEEEDGEEKVVEVEDGDGRGVATKDDEGDDDTTFPPTHPSKASPTPPASVHPIAIEDKMEDGGRLRSPDGLSPQSGGIEGGRRRSGSMEEVRVKEAETLLEKMFGKSEDRRKEVPTRVSLFVKEHKHRRGKRGKSARFGELKKAKSAMTIKEVEKLQREDSESLSSPRLHHVATLTPREPGPIARELLQLREVERHLRSLAPNAIIHHVYTDDALHENLKSIPTVKQTKRHDTLILWGVIIFALLCGIGTSIGIAFGNTGEEK